MNTIYSNKSLFLCFCLTLILSVNAQDKETIEEKQHGLQFYLINGFAAGYKVNYSEYSSFRLLLDFSLGASGADEESNNVRYTPDISTSLQKDDVDNSGFNISITPQYIISFYRIEHLDLYLGGGPFAEYNRSKSTRNSEVNYLSGFINKSYDISKYETYSVGLSLVLGAESNLTSNITIFAETHLRGGRSWTDHYSEQNNYDYVYTKYSIKEDNKGWFYSLSDIRLGVSIYF